MAQLEKSLLHDREDLSLIPSNHAKAVCGGCAPLISLLGRKRQADPWGLLVGHPSHIGELWI